MENKFYLKPSRHDLRYDTFGALFVFSLLFIAETVLNGFNVRLLYIVLLCFCLFIYNLKYHKNAGIYIDKKSIISKKAFFKKNVNINSIDCVRFQPEWENIWGIHKVLRDQNGNILFLMRFYHNYYEKDELDGYDFIEEIKRFFVERQICHCIYDKEALDYILTLNPNIKVVYYDQK